MENVQTYRICLYILHYTYMVFAYKVLCLPNLEYASAAWDPSSKNHISIMENVQTDAVCFIPNNKGRTDIGEEMKRLCLEPLDQMRKKTNTTALLSKEEQHPTLSAAYDDFLGQQTTSTVQT